MNTKLWVDDIRPPPTEEWDCARSFHEAVYFLEVKNYDMVSLDHDLGSFYGNREMTGYDIMNWLVARKLTAEGFVPATILVHSANPVGVCNIQSLIDQYWN